MQHSTKNRIERRGNTGQLVTVSEFGYDYASRRSFTREYDFANGGWANPVITRRVFDGLDVVQERNSSNQVTAQLVRDGNIGGILSRTTAAGAAFYGYDGNGNVTLLTNTAGQDVGHYRYDAFGNTLEAVGARAGENPYRFSTKELHGPSGLYDYGFRFYSPGMGRWLNRDPLGEGGGVNLYGMVGNNPVNDVDAYGLVRWKDVTDAVDKWVKDVLEPPKVKVTSDEPGADDVAAARQTTGLGSGVLPKDELEQRAAKDAALKAFKTALRSKAGFKAGGQAYIVDSGVNFGGNFAQVLRNRGYNVRSVKEIFGKDPKDPAILSLAQSIGARVLTADRGRDGLGFGRLGINIPDKKVRNATDAIRFLEGSKKIRR